MSLHFSNENVDNMLNCHENNADSFNGPVFFRLKIYIYFGEMPHGQALDSSIFMCGISPNWVFF